MKSPHAKEFERLYKEMNERVYKGIADYFDKLDSNPVGDKAYRIPGETDEQFRERLRRMMNN
ncbi:hypothetical protein P9850_02010 [Anoxybacillus rupiensis]|uniref:Uncharacterized protein n=1 Tax=Anoxybacteroides rupiense TaxID=311460 RepID=A0ABD5IQT5_9BACL|nr:hypothetical protein [Anoxybacillus rupiensis]